MDSAVSSRAIPEGATDDCDMPLALQPTDISNATNLQKSEVRENRELVMFRPPSDLPKEKCLAGATRLFVGFVMSL
jgi:hypothetical protein